MAGGLSLVRTACSAGPLRWRRSSTASGRTCGALTWSWRRRSRCGGGGGSASACCLGLLLAGKLRPPHPHAGWLTPDCVISWTAAYSHLTSFLLALLQLLQEAREARSDAARYRSQLAAMEAERAQAVSHMQQARALNAALQAQVGPRAAHGAWQGRALSLPCCAHCRAGLDWVDAPMPRASSPWHAWYKLPPSLTADPLSLLPLPPRPRLWLCSWPTRLPPSKKRFAPPLRS